MVTRGRYACVLCAYDSCLISAVSLPCVNPPARQLGTVGTCISQKDSYLAKRNHASFFCYRSQVQYLTFQKQFDLSPLDNVVTFWIHMCVPISIIFLRHLIFPNRPCERLREMVSQLWVLGAAHLVSLCGSI
jgi:hypothetical protein